jgi:hypothetical protein
MDNELLRILSEEVRETRRLANAAEKTAAAAEKTAEAAMKRADAAWEMVIIARNEQQDFKTF